VQIIDYLREMAHSLNYAVKPVFTYFENKHKQFDSDQINQFNEFRIEINNFFNYALYILKEKRFEDLDELIDKRNRLVENLKDLEKAQIKRIKNNTVSTRNSILYFNIISETKSLLLNLINVVKAQRDFIRETN
jgi:Na+/phosphate symporter